MFDINYVKNRNSHILASLDDISKIQNYVPLYSVFFSLNQSNFNSINLNHKYHITKFVKKVGENNYICNIKHENHIKKAASFFKFSPLIDPIKYMAGKYKNKAIDMLPSLEGDNCLSKIKNSNNAAYVDGFFSFLTSQASHTHGLFHGIDFYGSFLAIKDNFHYNIADDIDYLCQSNFFHKNRGEKFTIDNAYDDAFFSFHTRHYKKRLKLGTNVSEPDILPILSIDQSALNKVFTPVKTETVGGHDLIFERDVSNNSSRNTTASTKSSSCSSRSSHTSDGSRSSYDVSSCHTPSEYSSSTCSQSTGGLSTETEDVIEAVLKTFPVQIICLESLEGTLDSILEELDTEEWRSCLFQIIITLVMYQKMFDFTHNDLHTNNIMYKKTDKVYLCYRYKEQLYKVPTYGRIYKIIDFGRAIYKYKGRRICSDSFHPKGDAATQYNCEPYFNKNKARLDPNPSFDLCRLGCSLYDFFSPDEDDDSEELIDPITKLVDKWCKDDRGRNILYKSNGNERYPDFKLYKMIARTVHHCPAEKEIENPIFRKYFTSRKKIKKAKVLNVDTLPSYIN